MKMLRFVFVFIMLLGCCVASAQEVKTCLDYEPFQIDGNGNKIWAGRNIQVLHKVVERAGLIMAPIQQATFSRCMKMLRQGQVDVIPGLVYTDERAKFMALLAYSRREPVAVFHLPENELKIKQGSGLVLGFHRGFVMPNSMEFLQKRASLIDVTSVSIGLNMVERKRIDGFIVASYSGEKTQAESKLLKKKLVQTLIHSGEEKTHLGVSHLSRISNLADKLDDAIEELTKSGEINRILSLSN